MTVLEFRPRLSHRIAMAVQESGMTQTEIAEKMGISASVISRWVRGRRDPSAFDLIDLAHATGQLWLLDLRTTPGRDGDVSDQGERRSTCTGVSAGQRLVLNAA